MMFYYYILCTPFFFTSIPNVLFSTIKRLEFSYIFTGRYAVYFTFPNNLKIALKKLRMNYEQPMIFEACPF